jgi:hypothetical protein
MWTDLCFNLVLLMMSDYVFVLAASNVGYLIFNFLDLQAGWIHRIDRGNWNRPYKAATWLLALGAILGFVDLALMGFGADIYGSGTLKAGLIFACLIVPIFAYRHFIQDGGVFPKAMSEDLFLADEGTVSNKAGMLPYVALAAGVAVVFICHKLAVY